MELSIEQIQNFTKSYVQKTLIICEEYRASKQIPYTHTQIETLVDECGVLIGERKKDLALCNYDYVKKHVDKVLSQAGLDIPENSGSYRTLARELLKAEIVTLEIERKRTCGDYSLTTEEKKLVEVCPTQRVACKLVQDGEALFGQVVKSFWNENIAVKSWKPRTQDEYRSNLDFFVDFFGENTPIDTIDIVKLRDFKEIILSLPKHFRQKSKYQGVSLAAVAEKGISDEERISAPTINDKYLSLLGAVFSYAERNGFTKHNPAKGLKIKESKKRRASDIRKVFDKRDLEMLFASLEQDQPFKFWLPILALYTGCRLEELCQLYCEDLKQEDGIWILNISETHLDQSVKTSERRVVPLHPQIHKLGFVEFVQTQKGSGHDRIFSELKRQSNKYGHYPSRWFSQFKKRCGIKEDSGQKVFHSFRHTFYSNLDHQLISPAIIDTITGHARTGSQGQRRYAKEFPVRVLHEEAILKLDFGIDLSHLKRLHP